MACIAALAALAEFASVAAIADLELRGLAESRTAARDPARDPLDQRVRRHTRRTEQRLRERGVAEQCVRCLVALELRRDAEQVAEPGGGVADGESFGAGDVDDERRRRG